MNDNGVITFEEALKNASKFCKQNEDYSYKNILLANGFSIDCCYNIFTYKTLFDNSNFSEELKKIFNEFHTFDFEKIINKLADTKRIISIYDKKNKLKNQLKTDTENIKTELINVISKKHPEHQHKIQDFQYCSALKFLSNFNNIYTLNYDMLLYWTLMMELRNSELLRYLNIPKTNYKDCFGRIGNELIWQKNKLQNVFYLHGALHLFDDGVDIIKAETTEKNNLMDVIQSRLNNNQYPLIVTEGSSEEKLNKISHNKYLQNALENLRNNAKGVLFIHGHSLDDNDKHIINTINHNNNLKQIYISIFNPKENFDNMQQKTLSLFVNNKKNSKQIYYYDAKTAKVWNSIEQENVSAIEFKILEKKGN